ncbi:MAG: YbhB/YbcL family Raf kinase inhibitor-like protein [Cyclobacteriaceae bacterium]|nr:YbhB/YbcL family Raf kinase inhibitor-like protein [Cyclobacteriaceae bacterium]
MKTAEAIGDYKALAVRSPAFADHAMMPSLYTCEGENINPPLEIGDVPRETRSLVLIVEDPDAPAGTWLHWLVWNIPVTHAIKENDVPGEQGLNDFGRRNYGGPCPPSGTHRYYFRIYALDDLLELPSGSRRKAVEEAMRNHIVGFGETVGLYKRTKALTL